MNTISDRIIARMTQLGLKQTDLIKATNKTKGAVSKWVAGSAVPSGDSLVRLAQVLECDVAWLMDGDKDRQPLDKIKDPENIPNIIKELKAKIAAIENRKDAHSEGPEPSNALSYNDPVPVIEWVAAGSWHEANAVMAYDAFDYLPRPFNFPENGFALKVRGVSMMPKFEPGDFIYVDPNYGFLELKNGDLVVVREGENDEATFKQLIIGETAEDMYLKPLNPDWPEQRMTPKSEWELVGKVVGKWVAF